MSVNITASMVNDLRKKSGAGMMDCKKALVEADGDMSKAMDILRMKGAAIAAKRADRSANEGVVLTQVSADKKSAAIVEINCETDFVAKSEDFLVAAKSLLQKILDSKAVSVEDFTAKNPELESTVNELVGKVGEKITVTRAQSISVDNGVIADYVHPGNKIAVLVKYVGIPETSIEAFALTARGIAVQVAAMKPIAGVREQVPADVVAHEMEIYREQAKNEGKPENVIDRIANGRLEKYYQEVCLLEQPYFKDMSNPRTIRQLVDEFNKANGLSLAIDSFILYQLGDSKKS
jgi:elongation factor Ts